MTTDLRNITKDQGHRTLRSRMHDACDRLTATNRQQVTAVARRSAYASWQAPEVRCTTGARAGMRPPRGRRWGGAADSASRGQRCEPLYAGGQLRAEVFAVEALLVKHVRHGHAITDDEKPAKGQSRWARRPRKPVCIACRSRSSRSKLQRARRRRDDAARALRKIKDKEQSASIFFYFNLSNKNSEFHRTA